MIKLTEEEARFLLRLLKNINNVGYFNNPLFVNIQVRLECLIGLGLCAK